MAPVSLTVNKHTSDVLLTPKNFPQAPFSRELWLRCAFATYLESVTPPIKQQSEELGKGRAPP